MVAVAIEELLPYGVAKDPLDEPPPTSQTEDRKEVGEVGVGTIVEASVILKEGVSISEAF